MDIKKELAKRCAFRDDDLRFIVDVESVKTLFGEPISLRDVKKGSIVRIDFDHIDMAEAYKAVEGRKLDSVTTESILIHVKDIAEIDGKFFIETKDKSYSTVDMSVEWMAAKIQREEERMKNLVLGAIRDRDDKFNPRVDKLMDEIGVSKKMREAGITDRGDKKAVIDRIMAGVREIVGISTDFTEQEFDYVSKKMDMLFSRKTIDKIQALIDESIDIVKSANEYEEKKIVAEKLYDMGIPVFYFEPDSIPLYASGEGYKTPEERVRETFGRRNGSETLIEAKIKPMVSDKLPDTRHRFRNVRLENTIKLENGEKVYITNKGAFTSYDITEAYQDILRENWELTPSMSHPLLSPQLYASLIRTGSDSILSNIEPDAYNISHRYGFCNKIGYGNDTEIEETKDMLRAALESGRSVIHTKDGHEGATSPSIIDSNGINKKVSFSELMPGQAVVLRCDTNAPTDIESGDSIATVNGNLTIWPDEIYTVGNFYIMVTPDAVYTNMNEVAELAQDVILELQKEHTTDIEFDEH